MARRRYYRRYYKATPKKKWATNIIQSSVTTSGVAEICKNSSQTSSPTPVIVKCGNFRIQGDVSYSFQSTTPSRPVNINFFLIFCPEGVAANDSLIGNHPEWIIGWKNLDVGYLTGSSVAAAAGQSFSFTSRLKRNLNSGDRIVAILQSLDTSATAQAVFTCQYWTCAN